MRGGADVLPGALQRRLMRASGVSQEVRGPAYVSGLDRVQGKLLATCLVRQRRIGV